MYELRPIAEDVFFLKFKGTSWPTSSNVFLIADGDGLTLFDAGLNEGVAPIGLQTCIQEAGWSLSDVHTVVLTHGHTDHVAGVNFLKRFTHPRILIPEASIPEATEPSMQENAVLPDTVRRRAPRLKDFDILAEFRKTCGDWVLDKRELEPIRPGDELTIGQYRFLTIQTPGHDVGLTVFHEPDQKWLLSSDLLRASPPGNSLPWYSTTGGGVTTYLKSLDRVAGLDVAKAFPAHGEMVEPFDHYVGKTRAKLLDREDKILARLKKEPMTCEQLDLVLFTPMVLNICPWYSSCTEAQLQRLVDTGQVQRRDLYYELARS